jgi:allantoinase
LQIGLSAVWTEARTRGCTLADIVRWMSSSPARLAGLPAKGAIEAGKDADLCVFAPDTAFDVDPAALHHKNPIMAYAGRTLRGTVRSTWLRGRRIDPTAAPQGHLLRRGER